MNKHLLKDGLGWGILLWLFGYIFGIVLFMVAPSSLIGWIITPFGIATTVWVLFKKIHYASFEHYVQLAGIWTLIAIVFDYLFLVQVFKPSDGYYKADVYVYYGITCALPLVVGWYRNKK
jgi:hypothetical protein